MLERKINERELVVMISEKKPIKDIADFFKCSKSALYYFLKRKNIQVNYFKKRVNKVEFEKYVSQNPGDSVKNIAEYFGISIPTAQIHLNYYKLKNGLEL